MGLISIISIFAILIGIATPLTANFIEKENLEMANATERATSSVVAPAQVNAYGLFAPKGNSISEDVSGLAFAFDVFNVYNIKLNGNEANYDNATYFHDGKHHPLLGMGTIVHNKEAGKLYMPEDCDGRSILNVPTKYFFNQSGDIYTYAVRITNIPDNKFNTHITVIPYITVNMDGKIINVVDYRAVATRTFNEVEEGQTTMVCDAAYWFVYPNDNTLVFNEAYYDGFDWENNKQAICVWAPIPDTAGNMVNQDRLKIDIDKNKTITIEFDCGYCNEKHIYVIPKECRYHK